MAIKPRGWQEKALSKIEDDDKKHFLLVATPGAGKTIFSAFTAKQWGVDFIVIVVPTTALKGDSEAGFLGDWNKVDIDLKTRLIAGRGIPREFQGAVVTYQQLPNLISTLNLWVSNGAKLGFVFDEIHHASESNTWGEAVSICHDMAEKVLSMTGTPFRGDGNKITFLNYEDNQVVADYAYNYRQAVRDNVCREVEFYTDDGIAEYSENGIREKVKISECTDQQEPKVKATIYSKDSSWLETILSKADQKLDEYRINYNAGGIVICRPGNDAADDRHLLQVARKLKQVTGEQPTVITHDDPDANAKIESFRKSTSKWIVSVRKISEGVDIKRLRVMVMATKPGTELLFRQLVGRVVRQEDKYSPEVSTIYLAKFKQLQDWSAQIMQEAKAGIKERTIKKETTSRETSEDSDFVALGATHEHGGGISIHGEMFSASEIQASEKIKHGDITLSATPITTIAHIVKKLGIHTEVDHTEPPLQERKLAIRKEINVLVRRIAIRLQHEHKLDQPNFKLVWSKVHKSVGVCNLDDLFDNHSNEKAVQVRELLKTYLASEEDHEYVR